ncbi:MAG: peptide chain release factor 1 [Clostridia bacterium]|nr:peptide chain release factor 1 [Clostridia bacterium]
MLHKLQELHDKYLAMEARMSDPSVLSDPAAYSALMRDYKKLTPIMEAYAAYLRAEQDIADAQELAELGDPELKALAQDELAAAKQAKAELEDQLRLLLRPRNPTEGKNLIVEIRACAGGEEAALFAGVLYRMYCMYCAKQGFDVSPIHSNPTDLGGFREITFMVKGDEAWSHFRFESGVHRVQRVPETESQGRIQTSTASVAVLTEADEVEVEIKDSDLVFESCKSSGAGGQHINKTESAVRLTHKPSGIVIECDQERSQFQNKAKALMLLRTMLYDQKCREQNEKIAADRKGQVGTGDRSEKIRTYNYPQSRVTDHRIGVSVFNIDAFVDGDMTPIIQPLMTAQAALDLQNSNG